MGIAIMSTDFRLSLPPRRVPLSFVVVNTAGSKIAWLILAFASLFFWLFCMRADLSLLTFRPPYAEAQGTVTDVGRTAASENRQNIRAVGYSYHVQGAALSGTSYVVGDAPEPGERVTIEYLPHAPQKSRIAGMRRDLWSPWILLIALWPGVTLLIIIVIARAGLRRCSLLRSGLQTTARLVDKQPTNTRINGQMVYALTFEYETFDGQTLTTTTRTHRPERLLDEREEPLLYDPIDPARACLIDSLSSRPALDEAGNVRGASNGAVLFALLCPAIAVAINVLLFVTH
jgi:hypothetical protein